MVLMIKCALAKLFGYPVAFDNLCKLLSEQYPDRFAAWLLGEVPDSIRVLKTELSIEPIRADYVTFLETQERILHLEFQTKLPAEPPLPLRMLDYWVRLYRRYRLPITQVLVLLRPPTSGTVIETRFQVKQPVMTIGSCGCGNKIQRFSCETQLFCS